MFKRAFTLAEVLITLSIIGVISALTLPTLNTNLNTAQIGPKLAKAIATLEQANKSLLNDYDVGRLSDTGLLVQTEENIYINALKNYINIVDDDGYLNTVDDEIISENFTGSVTPVISNNGIVYMISVTGYHAGSGYYAASDDKVSKIIVDINGNKYPNSMAEDIFVFYLMDNGSVVPEGTERVYQMSHWKEGCQAGKIPTNKQSCAGHIFENNLRVLYKLR